MSEQLRRTAAPGRALRWLALGLGAALALAVPALGQSGSASGFGCRDLMTYSALPSVEGLNGVFFRIDPDLKTDHPLAARSVAQIAELSRRLAAQGTRLVYVPLPTKALMRPDALPDAARHLGYRPDHAAALFDVRFAALAAAGVAAVNARPALLAADAPVMRTDPRLSPEGARTLARTISDTIDTLPGAADWPRRETSIMPSGSLTLVSRARNLLQERCADTLPPLEVTRFALSAPAQDRKVPGTAVVTPDLVAEAGIGFLGFLTAATGFNAAPFIVRDDRGTDALNALLVSDVYRDDPPAVLVWVHPVWHNLARNGDLPLRSAQIAATGRCTEPLLLRAGEDGAQGADLRGLSPDRFEGVMLEMGPGDAGHVRFSFAIGEARHSRSARRAAGQGAVVMPLPSGGADSVMVSSRFGIDVDARLLACERGGTE